jgi:hypothetical protein
VRIAVSGSHRTGKSTLITAFLDGRPEYLHEPEAFETLADEIELLEGGVPAPDGLRALLDYTVSALESRADDANVVFERSPMDYLAYAAASGEAWPAASRGEFLRACAPLVRASLPRLQLIAYVPLPPKGSVRLDAGESPRFRKRVDERLRSALFDDAFDLFDDRARPRPRVVELPAGPDRQLAELVRITAAETGIAAEAP